MASAFNAFAFSRSNPRAGKKANSTSHAKANDTTGNALPGSWILADGEAFKSAPESPEDVDLRELNDCLQLLAEVFPDVQPEVFREMLNNISKQSRVEIVTEHLLKDKGKWVKGRYRTAAAGNDLNRTAAADQERAGQQVIAREEAFRSLSYRNAVKDAFYHEFRGLSHASIKAVLAEHNFAYSETRLVLQQLSSKSWRFYLTNFWSKHPKDTADPFNHPLINWQMPYGEGGLKIPYLRHTQSYELNEELYQTYIVPIASKIQAEQDKADAALATSLNEQEATEHAALFDCECCYNSVTFEEIVACDTGVHFICQQCIRATLTEALFGQGWTKTVDLRRSTLRCLSASSDTGDCVIPADFLMRAVLAGNDGHKVWSKFEDQISNRCLENCGIQMQRCPFCSYAEVKEIHSTRIKDMMSLAHHVAKISGFTATSQLSELVYWVMMQPLLVGYALLWVILQLLQTFFPGDFSASQDRVLLRRRGLRFQCRSKGCSTASCSVCLAKWSNPHICYETTTNSLRHAVEAATTAVIKRTCPRCNTSFVKSTGCNKLICPCGYSMCYICRSAIGSEGYGHFCQHFREQRGRCRECNRCDLYAVENEEAIVRQAALNAEKEWRKKEGVPSVEAVAVGGKVRRAGTDRLGHVTEEVLQGSKKRERWTWDGMLDTFLEAMLA
ncbi:hypothetical protein K461DRAFT_281173 [Myriangium duriaei CBS 260.36]|uniref:RING-type domain-containing protein n=1 Tax=Myriangium duriaei CBS 260.36 TaxID=1168546 RepID=A0A9P4ME87_9PEZI|nr:hypothetical protein K461DRAFT_281173 [Myriangium duriaei CBS 260.36]